MSPAARRTFLLWLLAMLAGLAVAWHSRFVTDMSFFLPAKPSAEQRVLVDQLKDGAVNRLLMIAIGGADAERRAALSRDLLTRLATSGHFAALRNGEAHSLDVDREFLFQHRYQLSPAVRGERFTVDGLQAAITDSVDLLASPVGLLLKPMFTRDPTGELLGLLRGLDGGRQPNSRHGVWVSRDGERAVLLAQTAAAGTDTDGQAAALAAIEQAFAQSRRAVGADDAALQIGGPGVFAVHARDTIKSEVTRLSSISTLAIVCLLLFVYRSFRLTIVGMLPVLSGALAGVVAVSLVYGGVFGITVGFGSALIGEAVDYSIYYFVQADRAHADDWRRTFWPTIRLGVMTSVCGFAVLLFSGFPGLAQLGLYSLSGLLVAALVTRYALPAWLPATPPRDLRAVGTTCAHGLQRLAAVRVPLLLLASGAAALLIAGRDTLWSSELSALSSARAEDVATDLALRADLGADGSRWLLVIDAADRELALQGAERVGVTLDRLQQASVIGGYETPARFLPSRATQAARLASLPAAAELRARLPAALRDLPLSADKLEPFVREIDAARRAPPIDAASLAGTSLALAVDGLLFERAGGWSALLPLRAPGRAEGEIDGSALRSALAASGALLVDMKAEVDQLYRGYLHEALWLSLAGLLAIVILLALTLRSPRRVFAVLTPLLLAVLFVVAGLHLAGVRLQLLHLVGMLLIVAVGSNYTLFFDRLRGPLTDEPRTIASLLVACTCTAIGFGTLALSQVPVLRALGVTVGPGALLALLCAAAFAQRKRGDG